MDSIPASRCPQCARTCAPPARFCPDDGAPMADAAVPAYGEVLSFTTLHSPPTGFAAPLHMALVQLADGAKFFCHGTETRGLKLGARVAIEAVGQVYYFETLSLTDRAKLFWRRRSAGSGERLSAFARSAAQRITRRSR